jgi:hypothetical protein
LERKYAIECEADKKINFNAEEQVNMGGFCVSTFDYINTALKVCEDKVNKTNVEIAIKELEDFCQRRKEEKYIDTELTTNSVQALKDKLLEIKNNS